MSRDYLVFKMTLMTAIVSLALFFVSLTQGWFGPYARSGCGFCEAMHPGLIKQPMNTWSNLGFVAAGLLMAWSLSNGQFQNNQNALTRSLFTGTFFSGLVVLLGPGSMAMHASGASLGGFVDVLSMYLVAGFLVAYSAQRFFRFKTVCFALVFVGVLGSCLWAHEQKGFRFISLSAGNLAFASALLLTSILETLTLFVRKLNTKAGWAYASLAILLISFLIWNVSRTGAPLCDPESLYQGHAAWHLLDALSVYCIFRFYVSEHTPDLPST